MSARASLSEIQHANILTPTNSRKLSARRTQSRGEDFNSILQNPPPISKLAEQLAQEAETPGSASSADSQEENRAIGKSRSRRAHPSMEIPPSTPDTNQESVPILPAPTMGEQEDIDAGDSDKDKASVSPSIFSFPPTSSPESDSEPPSMNNTGDSTFGADETAEAAAAHQDGPLDERTRLALQTEKRQLLQERASLLQRLQKIEQRVLLIDQVVSERGGTDSDSADPTFEVDYDADASSDSGAAANSPGVGVYWSQSDNAEVNVPNISSFDAGETDSEAGSDDSDDDAQADRDRARINQSLQQLEKELAELKAHRARQLAGESADSTPAKVRTSDEDSIDADEEDAGVKVRNLGAEFAANTINMEYVEKQGLEPVMLDTIRFDEQREALRQERDAAMAAHLDEFDVDSDDVTQQTTDSVAAEAAELIREAAIEAEKMQELSGVTVEDISADEADSFGQQASSTKPSRQEVLQKHRELQKEAQRLWQEQLREQQEQEQKEHDEASTVDSDSTTTSTTTDRLDDDADVDFDATETDNPDFLEFAANTTNLKYVKQQGLEPVLLNTIDFQREREALREERQRAMEEHVKDAVGSTDEVSAANVAQEAADLMREAVKEAEKLNKRNQHSDAGDSNDDAAEGDESTWRMFQTEAIKSMNGQAQAATTEGASETADDQKASAPVFAQLIGMGFDEALAREADARHSNYFEALKWILAESRRREEAGKEGHTDKADDTAADASGAKEDVEPKTKDYIERTNIFKSLSPAVIARARAAAATRRQQRPSGADGLGGGGAADTADNDKPATAVPSAPEEAATTAAASDDAAFVPPAPVFDDDDANEVDETEGPKLPNPDSDSVDEDEEAAEAERRQKVVEDTLKAAQAAAKALERQRQRELERQRREQERKEAAENSIQRRADMFKVQGNDLYRKGQYAAAVAAYTSAIDLVSENQIYWANRAAAKMMLFEYEGAIDDCRQAMSLPLPPGKPIYVKPQIRSGRAHLALGRADAARERFEMALDEIADARRKGRRGLEMVADDEESARKGLEHCRKYTSYCRTASLKLKMKEYQAGLNNALEALEIAGGSWEARCLVASAYITVRQFSRCADFCEGYLPESWVSVGQNRQGARHSPPVKRGRRDADAELGIRYAKSLHYQGYYCQAMDVLKEVIRDVVAANPRAPTGVEHAKEELRKMETMMRRHDNGNKYYRHEKYEEAYREYTSALHLDPLNNAYCAVVYANRAAAALALQRYESAIKDCTESLRRRPNMSKAQYRRARAYVQVKQYQKAIDDFEIVQKSELGCPDIGRELREAKLLLQKEQRKKEADRTAARLAEQRRRHREQREREKKEAQQKRQKEQQRRQQQKQQKQRTKAENPYAKYGYGPRYGARAKATGAGRYGAKSSAYGRQKPESNGWQAPPKQAGPKKAAPQADAPHRGMRGPRESDNYYQVLGITRAATKVQIKKAYHKLALKFHPDKNAGSPRTAADKFKLVNEAYSCLSDAAAKKKYDYKLRYGFEF